MQEKVCYCSLLLFMLSKSISFFFPSFLRPTWKEGFFFFTSAWRSCFILTFDGGTLLGLDCAKMEASHLATFIKLTWFMWNGGRILCFI